MKLEVQVVNLELSKKLKKLGVKQESLFDWYCQVGGIVCDTDVRGKWTIRPTSERNQGFGERCSAFTVAELGEILPGRIRLPDDDYWLWTTKGKDEDFWECRYYNAKREMPFNQIQEETEADARAKMLIHLIEIGVINP